MKLEDLVKYLRFEILDDFVTGWEAMIETDNTSELLWSNESLSRYINEAEIQAVRRCLPIKDFTTYTIDVVAAKHTYDVDPKIIRVLDIDSDDTGLPLTKTEYEELRNVQNWRTVTGTVTDYLIDYEAKKIRLYKIPTETDTLNLTVYRLPLKTLDWEHQDRIPEIREEYHIPMLHYAAFLAYSKQDADVFDPQKAAYHLQQFNSEFSDTSAYSETRKRREGKRTITYGGISF
jgi:hypothetical protein